MICLNFMEVAVVYHKAQYSDLFFSRCVLFPSVPVEWRRQEFSFGGCSPAGLRDGSVITRGV